MDMMYFVGKNKEKWGCSFLVRRIPCGHLTEIFLIGLREEVKKKEREQKEKLKDVNMAAPSFDRKILNEQHQRDQAAKAKERAQPKENAKFDMANALFGGSRAEE